MKKILKYSSLLAMLFLIGCNAGSANNNMNDNSPVGYVGSSDWDFEYLNNCL